MQRAPMRHFGDERERLVGDFEGSGHSLAAYYAALFHTVEQVEDVLSHLFL